VGDRMSRTICRAKKIGKVAERGKASVEWYKDKKPQYYCYGYKDLRTDELLEVCRDCKDNVVYAQEDLDNYKGAVKDE
jgi:hypothetical protein